MSDQSALAVHMTYYTDLYKLVLPTASMSDIAIWAPLLAAKFQTVFEFEVYILAGGPWLMYKGEDINWMDYGLGTFNDQSRFRAVAR